MFCPKGILIACHSDAINEDFRQRSTGCIGLPQQLLLDQNKKTLIWLARKKELTNGKCLLQKQNSFISRKDINPIVLSWYTQNVFSGKFFQRKLKSIKKIVHRKSIVLVIDRAI